jgi:preprotein translocase subunit YajC
VGAGVSSGARLQATFAASVAVAWNDCVVERSGWMFAMWLQSAAGGLGSLGSLALPILFFVVLYFLMIAPNQKKQKKWQEMLGQLKSGDRVTTNGGIRGTVLTVKDDIVILRVQPDGIKLEFVKSAIAAVTTDEQAA